MTRSTMIADDLAALFRSRAAVLWIVTREEARSERYIIEAAASANYVAHTWDCAAGVRDISGNTERMGGPSPDDALSAIRANTTRGVWIMRDLPTWLDGAIGIQLRRQLRNLARELPSFPRDRAQAVVIISPDGNVPAELANHTTVIEWPMPDREEIGAILNACIEALPAEMRETAAPNGQYDKAIDAAIGLSGEEAQACYAKSLVQLRRIDPLAVGQEKKRVIARERVLEWFDPLPGGLDSVGGLDALKAWLKERALAYSPKARAYGLPAPKGCLLVGVPGCGKSLTAKAIATAYGVPLLRLDLGALQSKFVGESQANIRKAFRVIESVGRCVVWLDEIEKALAGATQGAADGGVSSDALGTILSWMQDRQGEAFVIATANDISKLPPELLRKGRFDEVWFIDLPNAAERAGIIHAALRAHARQAASINGAIIADATDTFTGAEIAAIVPDAMFQAFADGEREITTDDLVSAARRVTPLAKTAADKIKALQDWAPGKARFASAKAETTDAPAKRVLDL